MKTGGTLSSFLLAIFTGDFFGIPAGVFTSAVFCALINNIDSQVESDKDIIRRGASLMRDALFGGWITVFVVLHPRTAPEFQQIGGPIIAGLLTLWMPWLRQEGPRIVMKVVDILLNVLAKFLAARTSTPPPEEKEP